MTREEEEALGGHPRRMPGPLNRNGLTLDKMRKRAHEGGYIGRYGQDTQGAFGSTVDDFVTALQDEMNAPRGTGSSGRMRDQSLAADVDRELSERGLSVNDRPDQVLPAVRDPNHGANPGQAAPDGYAPLPGGMTPEQAARRQQALAVDRQYGRDFGRDNTGNGAVANILRRGEGGGWSAPDNQVVSQALSSPDAARQVLRAAGPDAEGAHATLQQGFMDRAHQATAATDATGATVLRGEKWQRFWAANRDMAGVLFPPEQVQRLELLGRDFAETASRAAAGTARQAGSPGSLSVANLIAQVTRGTVDPGNVAAQAGLHYPSVLMRLGEGGIRTLMQDAMADPELAMRLVRQASPEAVERAAAYISTTQGQRAGRAVGNFAGQQAMVGADAAEADPDRKRRGLMAARLAGVPQDAIAAQRNAMARQLLAPGLGHPR